MVQTAFVSGWLENTKRGHVESRSDIIIVRKMNERNRLFTNQLDTSCNTNSFQEQYA